jgi:Sec7-like guanine-nucleotide exchange factor
MERFAEKFCEDNPETFENATTAFVLAFSTIMLQTDAHNPTIKNKMTVDSFCTINRGINNGKDLPREFLEEIYHDIISHPIRLAEDIDRHLKLRRSTAAEHGRSEMIA